MLVLVVLFSYFYLFLHVSVKPEENRYSLYWTEYTYVLESTPTIGTTVLSLHRCAWSAKNVENSLLVPRNRMIAISPTRRDLLLILLVREQGQHSCMSAKEQRLSLLEIREHIFNIFIGSRNMRYFSVPTSSLHSSKLETAARISLLC